LLLIWILSIGLSGKKMAVITVSPLSANNSTEAASTTRVTSEFGAAVNLGAVNLPLKSF
jgi:hypothetical protein